MIMYNQLHSRPIARDVQVLLTWMSAGCVSRRSKVACGMPSRWPNWVFLNEWVVEQCGGCLLLCQALQAPSSIQFLPCESQTCAQQVFKVHHLACAVMIIIILPCLPPSLSYLVQ
jgi:hypothetical protein